MRELETSLRQFREFLLRAQLVKEKAAPLRSSRARTEPSFATRSGVWLLSGAANTGAATVVVAVY